MIKLQPISTSDLQHYKFMEELLVDAFPPEEYRQLEELREYTDRTGNFHNNIIFDDDLPIGFITYWDFDRFYYVNTSPPIPPCATADTGNGRWNTCATTCNCLSYWK